LLKKKPQNNWDLVVINPTLVLGPGINPNITSESFNLMKQLGDGSMGIGVPDFEIGLVDVRDLAIAHFNVAFKPDSKGRHLINAESKTFLQMADMLRENYGDKLKLPKKKLPNWIVILAAPIIGQKRKMLTRNLGYPWTVDNRKSIEKLNIKYRPIKESINDFFDQMYENGAFKK